MKRSIIFFATLCYLSVTLSAQELVNGFISNSKASIQESSIGALIRKDFYSVKLAESLNFSMTAVLLTDLRTGDKIPYVIISTRSGSWTPQSIIDIDEIPSIIETLEYIISSETKELPNHDVTVSITTRDALEISASYSGYEEYILSGAKPGSWEAVIRHRKYLSAPGDKYSIKRLKIIIDGLRECHKILSECQS